MLCIDSFLSLLYLIETAKVLISKIPITKDDLGPLRKRNRMVDNRQRYLVEAAPAQVVCYNDIGNGVEYELNVVCICGAGHVTVDLLGGGLVLGLELRLDVGCRFAVLLGAWWFKIISKLVRYKVID